MRSRAGHLLGAAGLKAASLGVDSLLSKFFAWGESSFYAPLGLDPWPGTATRPIRDRRGVPGWQDLLQDIDEFDVTVSSVSSADEEYGLMRREEEQNHKGHLLGTSSIRMPKTADVIAARLRAFILAERVPPGVPLPNEPQLIEYFGVSRASIREALRILEAEGLIEVRRGAQGGVFTMMPSVDRVMRSVASLVAYNQTPLSDLLVIRLLIEPEAAAMAASSAALEDRQKLLNAALASDSQDVAQQTQFHFLLGRLCGNGVLSIILQALREVIADTGATTPPAPSMDAVKRAHVQIATAIVAADANAAREATHKHLRAYNEYLRSTRDLNAPIISFADLDERLLKFLRSKIDSTRVNRPGFDEGSG